MRTFSEALVEQGRIEGIAVGKSGTRQLPAHLVFGTVF